MDKIHVIDQEVTPSNYIINRVMLRKPHLHATPCVLLIEIDLPSIFLITNIVNPIFNKHHPCGLYHHNYHHIIVIIVSVRHYYR